MVRINLLPRDILERRKYERFFPYVYLTAGVLVIVVLVVWGFLLMQVNAKADDLQKAKATADGLNRQAEAFAPFEQKEADLAAREKIAGIALAQRVSWARLLTELSMVLPDDTWINRLTISSGVLNLECLAVDEQDATDIAHKSVVRTLVRLNELEQLFNVWLAAETRQAPVESDGGESEPGLVKFPIEADVVIPPKPVVSAAPIAPAQ